MSDISQPPVLHKSEDVTDILKDIDENIKEQKQSKPRKKRAKKEVDPLKDLKKQISSLEKSVKQGVDVSNMSLKERKAYLKVQNEENKKQKEEISDLIKETRETLLKKKNLSAADKTTLKELRKIQKETEKSGITERHLLKDLFDKLPDNLKEGFQNIGGGIAAGIMGPLNLVVQPLKEAFGINFGEMFSNAFSSIKDKFFNKSKIKPKRSQMLKTNPEAVYIVDELTKDKKKDEKKKSSLLDGLMGSGVGALAGKLFPALMKALPIAAIAGGLIWGVVDAIAAIGKADEWGVSKTAAGMGGFFAGTKSGFKGAISNMGKWALIGFGVGWTVGGPVGGLAGALLGAGFGAVLGYIGGENVAKGFQSVGNEIMKAAKGDLLDKVAGIPLALINGLFNGIGEFVSTIPQMIVQGITGDAKKALKAKNFTKNFVDIIINSPLNPLTFFKNYLTTTLNIKNILKDPSLTKGTKYKKIMGELITMPFRSLLDTGIIKRSISSMGNFISPILTSLMTSITSTITGAKNKVFDISAQVGMFFASIFEKAIAGLKGFFDTNPAVKFVKDYVVTPISNFFQTIGDFFDFFKGKNIIDIIKTFASGNFGSEFAGFKKSKDMERTFNSDEYIKWAATQKNNRSFASSTADQKYESFNKTKVNDAIITPAGRIIQPSKDDTIIATKNKVSQGFGESDMDSILSKLNAVIENNFSDQAVVEAIKELITVVKEKPVGGGFSPQVPSIDINSLRSL